MRRRIYSDYFFQMTTGPCSNVLSHLSFRWVLNGTARSVIMVQCSLGHASTAMSNMQISISYTGQCNSVVWALTASSTETITALEERVTVRHQIIRHDQCPWTIISLLIIILRL